MARDASSTDVASVLGVSAATVQRYARDGKIPFDSTPGGHRRFDMDEVREGLGLTGRSLTPAAIGVLVLRAVEELGDGQSVTIPVVIQGDEVDLVVRKKK